MIWQLIYKDILRRFKSPLGVIVLTAMPLIFTLLMGFVFAPNDNGDTLPKIHLFIEDHDNSVASNFISGAFTKDQLGEMFQVDMITDSSGRKQMNQGKASALLIIPAKFGDSLLNEKPVALELIKNPAQAFGPKIAEEVVDVMVEAGNRLLRLADTPLGYIRKAQDGDVDLSDAQIALIAVQFYRLAKNFENYIFPPKIELNTQEEKKEEDDGFDLNKLFAYLLAGITVMSLLFMMEVLARDMFQEQENHTLYRLLVSPVNLLNMISAKLIFFVIWGFVSHTLVWLIGDLFMGIDLAVGQWIKILIFSIVMLAALSSIINILYSFIKTRNQAQSIAPAVIIFFSMLGGSMIPIENLPGFVQKVAVISPVYWGVKGLKSIVLDNGAWADIAQNMFVLGLIALVFTTASTALYYRKYRL